MQAINNLAPNSQFTVKNDDYSTIEWHVLEGKAPTKAQVDAEIVKIKGDEAKATAQAKIDKAAILDRLGITAEEAALLLG
jgi:hypothetical protein